MTDDDYILLCDQTLDVIKRKRRGRKRTSRYEVIGAEMVDLEKKEVAILKLRSIFVRRKESYAR